MSEIYYTVLNMMSVECTEETRELSEQRSHVLR